MTEEQQTLIGQAELNRKLVAATTRGNAVAVNELLEAGANPKSEDDNWLEVILIAASLGHTAIMAKLAEHGADIDTGGGRALRLAAWSGHTETARWLIEAGLDVHAGDDEALICAANRGCLETVRMLLEAGARLGAQEDGAIKGAIGAGHKETREFLLRQYNTQDLLRLLKDCSKRSPTWGSGPTEGKGVATRAIKAEVARRREMETAKIRSQTAELEP